MNIQCGVIINIWLLLLHLCQKPVGDWMPLCTPSMHWLSPYFGNMVRIPPHTLSLHSLHSLYTFSTHPLHTLYILSTHTLYTLPTTYMLYTLAVMIPYGWSTVGRFWGGCFSAFAVVALLFYGSIYAQRAYSRLCSTVPPQDKKSALHWQLSSYPGPMMVIIFFLWLFCHYVKLYIYCCSCSCS